MKIPWYISLVMATFLMVAGCGSSMQESQTKSIPKAITPDNLKDLDGIEWRLTKMIKNGAVLPLSKTAEATFACQADGKVAGLATINRYFGSLRFIDAREIKWSPFGSTRMAGPQALMQQENEFLNALAQTQHMILSSGNLIIETFDRSIVLEFAKIE